MCNNKCYCGVRLCVDLLIDAFSYICMCIKHVKFWEQTNSSKLKTSELINVSLFMYIFMCRIYIAL